MPKILREMPDLHQNPASNQRNVLVIDDSALIREAVRIGLGAAGWNVWSASGSDEGLDLASSERPDAILLDMVMPDADGLTVAGRLHALPSTVSIPIVMLTAQDLTDDEERLREVGAVGVITKPFDAMALADELGALLGWSS